MIESPVLESKHVGSPRGPRKLSALEPSWRAWSIWEVYEKDARTFLAGATVAHGMMKLLDNEIVNGSLTMQDFMPDGVKGAISKRLEEAAVIFGEMGATASHDYVRRVQRIFEQRIKVHTADHALQGIGPAFYDEMARWRIFFLNREEAALYDHGEIEFFGLDVWAAFPSARNNMTEAAKCFVLNRWPACAYHCMSVVESGIRALCKELDTQLDLEAPDCTWGKMLQRLNNQIDGSRGTTAPRKVSHVATWNEDEVYFSDLLIDLRNIQKAMRNPAMHFRAVVSTGDEKKDHDAARRVMDSTGSFMRSLSEKVMETA